MYEEVIPEFFAELGHAVAKENLTYTKFREKYPERVEEIAKKYV